METVAIGCRLPAGFVLEIGLQTTIEDFITKRPITMVHQTAKYQRITLHGTHQHTAEVRAQKIQVPMMANPEPWINRGVPKEFWEQWKKEHPGSWLVKTGQLFEVANPKDSGNVKAMVDAAKTMPAILQPLEQGKSYKTGPNGEMIESRKTDEE